MPCLLLIEGGFCCPLGPSGDRYGLHKRIPEAVLEALDNGWNKYPERRLTACGNAVEFASR